MKRIIIVDIITILTLSLFLYAGISKVIDYKLFKEQLAESPVMQHFASFIAVALPIVEFALVALLLVPRWRLKGLVCSAALLFAFTVYIVVMMLTSDHLPCSCGGLLELLSWKGHIFFNSGFIVMDAIGIWLERSAKKQHRKDIVAAFG